MADRRRMQGTEPAVDWIRMPVSLTEHHLQVYNISFLCSTKLCLCPFPRLPGYSRMWNGFHSHFISYNWGDRIRILEENPNPLPKCDRCGSQVPAGILNTCHYAFDKSNQGEERRIRRKTLQHCFEEGRVLSQINAETLTPSESFPYIGKTIAYNNSD